MEQQQPLNFALFWSMLGKLILRLMKDRAHGQITITIHDGNIPVVEVSRRYRPGSLPET
jgi:hypothetical protein